jgi:hypothetical protein
MMNDLRGMIFRVGRAGGELASAPSSDFSDWGWVGLVASERGLRLLALESGQATFTFMNEEDENG